MSGGDVRVGGGTKVSEQAGKTVKTAFDDAKAFMMLLTANSLQDVAAWFEIEPDKLATSALDELKELTKTIMNFFIGETLDPSKVAAAFKAGIVKTNDGNGHPLSEELLLDDPERGLREHACRYVLAEMDKTAKWFEEHGQKPSADKIAERRLEVQEDLAKIRSTLETAISQSVSSIKQEQGERAEKAAGRAKDAAQKVEAATTAKKDAETAKEKAKEVTKPSDAKPVMTQLKDAKKQVKEADKATTEARKEAKGEQGSGEEEDEELSKADEHTAALAEEVKKAMADAWAEIRKQFEAEAKRLADEAAAAKKEAEEARQRLAQTTSPDQVQELIAQIQQLQTQVKEASQATTELRDQIKELVEETNEGEEDEEDRIEVPPEVESAEQETTVDEQDLEALFAEFWQGVQEKAAELGGSPIESPPPDNMKVPVNDLVVDDQHRWTFAMAWANEAETLFVAGDAESKHHLVVPKDEKVVVTRVDGEGEPKEVTTTRLYPAGEDATGAAAVEALLADGGAEAWFPVEGPPTDAAAPDTHKIRIEGLEKDDHRWTFAMAWVNEAGSMFLKTGSPNKHHLVVAEGEQIVVTRSDDESARREITAAQRYDVGEDETGAAAIEALLQDDGTVWYPPAGPPTDSPLPDTHKLEVTALEHEGHLWTFAMAWVSEDESMFVKGGSPNTHHLLVPEGTTVTVTRADGEGIPKEVTTAQHYVGGTDESGVDAVTALFGDGGADRWYPREGPSIDDGMPDGQYRIDVEAEDDGREHNWTFAMAWVDANESMFLKDNSDNKDHLVVPAGEKVVVARSDGQGDPRETTTERAYAVGTEKSGSAAVAALFEDGGAEKWYPASLEDQQGSKLDDLAKAVEAVRDAMGDLLAGAAKAAGRDGQLLGKIKQARGTQSGNWNSLSNTSPHDDTTSYLHRCLTYVAALEELGVQDEKVDLVKQTAEELGGSL